MVVVHFEHDSHTVTRTRRTSWIHLPIWVMFGLRTGVCPLIDLQSAIARCRFHSTGTCGSNNAHQGFTGGGPFGGSSFLAEKSTASRSSGVSLQKLLEANKNPVTVHPLAPDKMHCIGLEILDYEFFCSQSSFQCDLQIVSKRQQVLYRNLHSNLGTLKSL